MVVSALVALPPLLAVAAEPRVQLNGSVTQTLTDNYLLTGVRPESDAVSRLTAGVGLTSQSGRTRGFLDYALSGVVYARHSQSNQLQNTLNANFSAELAEGRSRLDVRAGISQSAISAFGPQPGTNSLNPANATELRFLSVAPVVYGPLGPGLRYTAALNASLSDAKGTDVGDSVLTTATVRIEPTTAQRLSWAVDGTAGKSDYKAGRATTTSRLNGTAFYPITDLDLKLSASAGGEVTDINSLQRKRYATYGMGAVWTPSPRTSLTANFDDRAFGRTHNLSLEHRTALTTWRFSDSRSVSTPNGENGAGNRGTAYNLLFAQFGSIEPDPVKRADLVNSVLLRSGISPTAQINPSFLNSGVSLQDRQEVSVAMRGVRSTAVLSYLRTTTSRLDQLTTAVDDLSRSSLVHLQGFSLDLSHRLTPVSSINLLLSDQRGNGDLNAQRNRQRQASLLYALRPTERGNLSVGLRRAQYETASNPFSETAIFATYGTRF
jgi:uncharacterized protein (PEP-CTERM system associated)